jgi:hypothetical protein
MHEETLHFQNNTFNKVIARHNQLRLYLRFLTWKVRLWTPPMLSPPLSVPLLQVTNHQANSHRPKKLETPLLVLKSWLPWDSLLADFTMEWEIVPHDCNSHQRFAVLPLKPNGQIKTWVHYDQILSDLAISKNEYPSGVCRRSILEHDTPAISTETGIR